MENRKTLRKEVKRMNDEEKKVVKKRSFREEVRLFLRSYGIIRECQP